MKGSLIGASPWYKLFIVFVLVISSSIITLLIGSLFIPVIFDFPLSDLMTLMDDSSSMAGLDVNILKYLQGVGTVGTFMIPGLVGAYLISSYPKDFLGLETFPKKVGATILLVFLLTIGSAVISDLLYRLSLEFTFPEFLGGLKDYLDDIQESTQSQMGEFLQMKSPIDFIEMLLIMAILPAVCEETLFRGLIQPLFIKGFQNVHAGIIITSILFGLLHQQLYSFLSITALSIVLGYLKYWSKSLWVPIIMHFFNNGILVASVYFYNISLEEMSDGSSQSMPVIVIGLIVFGLALFGLKKMVKPTEYY